MAVLLSLFRSLTFSFGSICFGSLLQALVSVFRFLVESARNQRERNDSGALCLCVLECIARLFEDILEYFNQWAYVFVGIYGYSYLESGRKVMELFRARGWTALITNSLVGYFLAFTTVAVAFGTGGIAIVVEAIVSRQWHDGENESYLFGPLPGWRYAAFGIGFLIGLWVSSVMMNVVKGTVNALIVCWADSPTVMETNHPRLTKEMAEAWVQVFPESRIRTAPAYAATVV